MQTNSKIIAKIKIYSVTVPPPGKTALFDSFWSNSNSSTVEM
jgi:hypothetical protein